jgi:hypothetical protein
VTLDPCEHRQARYDGDERARSDQDPRPRVCLRL